MVQLEDSEVTSHLHCYRKVVLGLWWKKHIYCFLWERLVPSWWGSHFDDVQLQRGRKTKKTKGETHTKTPRECLIQMTIDASQSPFLQPGL